MSKRRVLPDYSIIVIVTFLAVLGLLVSVKIFADVSQKQFNNSTYYLFHQLFYGFLPGIIMGFIFYKAPLNFIKKWSWLFVLISLFLMGLVFIPGLGISSNGASRWISFGRFTFQPSEILKLTFLIYLSALLAKNTSNKKEKKWQLTLFPFLVILGLLILLLYFQSDLSTLGVIALSAMIMYFCSETPLWHTLLISFLGAVSFLILIVTSPYRMERISVLLGWVRDPLGIGYQTNQTLIAIGSGGILGLGLELSPLSNFIPHLMSDSIFAEISRDLGLIGGMLIISLYLALLWRGFKIANNVNDKFSQLLSIGLISWICFQAFVNIGAMIKIFPLTGIPLPFISYGGSHIVAELAAVGLLLNISKQEKR